MRSTTRIFRTAILIIILVFLVSLPLSSAEASTQGPKDAGTGSNVADSVGTEMWLDPGEVTSPGSPYATVTLSRDNRYSYYLEATNYSFNIPPSATINGIEVMINRMATGNSPSILDNVVSLLKAGENPGESVLVGFNKASLIQWPKNTLTTAIYGSSSDLWGTTWTADEIDDSTFGVALAVYRQDSGNVLREAAVNFIQITVYYTIGPATMSVDCGNGTPEVTYGDSITCKAIVTDTGFLTPTGTVDWTTDGNGIFDDNSCNLAEDSIGVASCEAIYTPAEVGHPLITADYSGDVNFDPGTSDETLDVLKKPASVTPEAASKTYGEADPALTGTLDGFLPADNVTATYSRVAGDTVAGSPYEISATLSPIEVLGNYDVTYNHANFTITKRPITATADAKSKTYGNADPALSFQTTSGSLAYSDSFSGDLTRDPGETVGTYAIRQGTLGLNDNYTLTFVGGLLTISQRPASVTPNAASKTYGDANPTLTGTLDGFLPADNVTATYSRVAGETVAGSPYLISATLSPIEVLGNYNLTYNTANFSITKRPITVTADAKMKVIGQPDPELTYKVTSGSTAFSDTITGALTRDAGETVGAYAIRQGTLTLNDNYTLTYIGSFLTITKLLIYLPIIRK
jgi:hypothetical protein